eukprot:3117250-Pyramimonas_sp.AAC.1
MPRLPKPEGGHRLIGLLPDLLRVYNRCHYVVAGRSSEQAVWSQSLIAEAGLALKRHTATVMLDPKK